MNCKFTEEGILLFYYGELDVKQREEFQEHLKECKTCRAVLDKTAMTLDNIKLHEPELDDSFWINFRTGVRKRIEEKSLKNKIPLFRFRPVQSVIVMLMLIISITGGYKYYLDRQQEKFIMNNIELIMNVDMFEDLEIIENLDEFSEV